MARLTIDPTRLPEKGDLIIITPDRRAIIVEADKLGYAQVEIMDITPPAERYPPLPPWLQFPPRPTYSISVKGEVAGYAVMKTGSLKRVMRYLEKRKKEKKKHV